MEAIHKPISNLKEPFKSIAAMASKNGIILHPTQVHDEVHTEQLMPDAAVAAGKKPSLKRLQEIVGGYIEFVRVPSIDVHPKTILVVNEEGRLKGMKYNSLCGQLFCMELVGPVIWLPTRMVSGG